MRQRRFTLVVVGAVCAFGACVPPVTTNPTTTSVCGNDKIEEGELCDRFVRAVDTCETEGFDKGELGCSSDCLSLITTGCQKCGNGEIEGDEVCDLSDVGADSCVLHGATAGSLGCSSDCKSVVLSGCSTCGNNVAEGTESCDGTDRKSKTCVSEGFAAGALSCSASCTALVTTGCELALPTCNDGALNGSEVCDGVFLNGKTCASEVPGGNGAGTLACSASCASFDTTACCGDGTKGGTEECDGTDFGDATCATQGHHTGTLACSPSCTIVETGCYSLAINELTGVNPDDRIELYNLGPAQADITNWTIKTLSDGGANRFSRTWPSPGYSGPVTIAASGFLALTRCQWGGPADYAGCVVCSGCGSTNATTCANDAGETCGIGKYAGCHNNDCTSGGVCITSGTKCRGQPGLKGSELDYVRLYSPDQDSAVEPPREAVSFHAGAGVIGRLPDGTGSFTLVTAATFGATNSTTTALGSCGNGVIEGVEYCDTIGPVFPTGVVAGANPTTGPTSCATDTFDPQLANGPAPTVCIGCFISDTSACVP